MTIHPPSPEQQSFPVVPLSSREAEAFITGLKVDCWTSHNSDQLTCAFNSLSPETQRLLVGSYESDLITKKTMILCLDDYAYTLFYEWDESGEFASLAEATAISDARLFSSLLVLGHLGRSLCMLGRDTDYHLIWIQSILNEYVAGPEKAYRKGEAYRLSTMDDVAAIASLTTYAAMDTFIHDQEVEIYGRDNRDPLVAVEPDIYPRASADQGIHCDYMLITHPELELLLRGRSLADYDAALRIVTERNVGTSVEDAKAVLAQVELTRSLSRGFL